MRKLSDENLEVLLADAGPSSNAYFGVRRIGASGIGDQCDAFIALSLRSFPEAELTGVQKRRMALGKHLEELVIADLKSIGVDILDKHPISGRQFLLEGFEKHLKAYMDGMAMWDMEKTAEPIEIKSMAAKRFNAIRKKGLKAAEPKYYDQVITIMGMSLSRSCLFVAINKDNSEYLVRRIEFDDERWAFIRARIERILSGSATRNRSFMCKLCPKAGACLHGEEPPVGLRECHHCKFASPDVGGKWWCEKNEGFATGVCEAFELFQPDD